MTGFRSLVALAGLLVVGGCGETSVSSGESCPAPRALLSVHHVSPGERLSVRVNYTVACQDTNHPQGEPVVPARYRAVKIRLVQGATQTTLGTADTDREGYLSARVTIPASVTTGDALIRVDHVDEDALLTIQ
jgi:hypothetical protein